MTYESAQSIATVTITPQEAAQLVGVCERTIRRACERGELPAARIGRRWRINREKFIRRFDGSAAIAG